MAPSARTMSDFVGLSIHIKELPQFLRLVDLGIHRIRTDIKWQDIEPTDPALGGTEHWGQYDTIVGTAQQWGFSVLGILDYGNNWPNTDPCAREDEHHHRPPDPASFAGFAQRVVQHYDAQMPGTVTQYEVWNEANLDPAEALIVASGNGLTSNWSLGATDPTTGACENISLYDPMSFGQLVQQTITTIDGIRGSLRFPPTIAPGGLVFLAEITNRSSNDYLSDMLSQNPGLGNSLGAGAFHAYNAYPPTDAPESQALGMGAVRQVQLGDKISQTRSAFSNGGMAASKPLWLTEIGWANANGVQYADQAAFLIRSIMIAALGGVDQIYLYKLMDDSQSDPATSSLGVEDWFGILNPDGSPKMSYDALHAFFNLLGTYRVVQRVAANDPNNSAYIVQLTDGSNTCYVAWDSAGDKAFNWPVPAHFAVYDMVGAQQHVGTSVRLTGSPIYSCQQPAPPPPADVLVACNGAGDPTGISYNGTGTAKSTASIIDYCDDAAGRGEFQCDQFVNRFVSSLNLPPVDNWVDNVACQICDLVAGDPKLSKFYSVLGPGYGATAGLKPAANDLLVWSELFAGCSQLNKSAPGHVAAVTGADDSFIYYTQQNWMVNQSVSGSAYAALPRSQTDWDPVASFFGSPGGPSGALFAPRCWIHPTCPLGASCNPGISANPCDQVTHVNNGQYCGTSRQANFDKNNAYVVDAKTVYECFDGQVANETRCAAGCFIAAAGHPDGCNTSDPCAQATSANNGLYCGGSTQASFNKLRTANLDSVYRCQNGRTVEYAACPPSGGCTPAPAGQPDVCSADPCAHVGASHNGLYCGASSPPQNGFNTGHTANPTTLYKCVNGHTADTADCDHGCYTSPDNNTPDGCIADPCSAVPSSGNGTYCGNSPQMHFDSDSADKSTLYYCQDGHTLWAEFCAIGCSVAPAGLPDQCRL